MATALATSPLDVLRTRLQTDFYQTRRAPSLAAGSVGLGTSLGAVRDTVRILASIRHTEGWRGLFRGLGPSLTGVVPASAIKFWTYGNCKRLLCDGMGWHPDTVTVQAVSASSAGMATALATKPIWLVKTRLQLDKEQPGVRRRYRSSLDCVAQVLRQEGVRGLYRGLSASVLGAAETTLHLVLYEQMKILFARGHTGGPAEDRAGGWMYASAAAGASKLLAALAAYPHEVTDMLPCSRCARSLTALLL